MIFFIIGISQVIVLNLKQMSWYINNVYEPCDIAILNIKGSDNCCIISLSSKNEAIKLMQNADFTKKVEHYKFKKYLKNVKFI